MCGASAAPLWSGAVQETSTSGVRREKRLLVLAIGRSGDESFSTSNHLVLSIVAGIASAHHARDHSIMRRLWSSSQDAFNYQS
jgi:hypothetical protein